MASSNSPRSDSAGGKPLSDLAYDVIAILHEKSQALEAYDDYLEDAEENDEVRELLEEIREQDEENVRRLEQLLPQLIGSGPEEEFESSEEDEESPGRGRKRGAA
jgi:bacterioferritin (cytochrome b1)